MRSKFDEQLLELNSEMIKMGNMIETNITRAIEALTTKDVELAKQIMDSDVEVDKIQTKIESICFSLLIQQQPVASDLRTITAAMKMVTDMERIGDHAADISEMTVYLGVGENHANFKHINKMASETVLMLNWAVEAYVEKDEEKAKKVIDHDDVVDDLFCEVKKDIINLIHDNPDEGEDATDLLMIAKYFERIGDHATNIAEAICQSMQKSQVDNLR